MKKILLIDDDPDVITVLQLLLKKKQVESFEPDLIVLDVLLSGVDGREICKKLKNSPESKHIPIIMFSAHPSAQKNMGDFGADDFLPKPFESSKILERIEAQLSKRTQAL